MGVVALFFLTKHTKIDVQYEVICVTVHLIWLAMTAGSLLYAAAAGTMEQMLEAALMGAENAIGLTLRLCAGYMLFCGLMEIAREAGTAGMLERWLKPLLRRLMPAVRREETQQAVALNLSMNMLGLGNAATPMGLQAVRLMDEEALENPKVRHDLYMLLILNSTSLQLLPTTVLSLRAAAGSADVQAVVLPTLLCTAFSTLMGVMAALLLKRRKRWLDG